MNYLKSLLLLLLFMVIGSGCGSNDPYEEMAQAMCDCMKPMAEMYTKIQDLSTGGDTNELASIMSEMEQVAADAETCTDEMSEKYGEPEDPQKANETLKRICPEVASVIDDMDSGLQ